MAQEDYSIRVTLAYSKSDKVMLDKKRNNEKRLTAIFFALSDKTRRAILALLIKEDLMVSSISNRLGIKIGSASKHLQILIRSKLVQQKRHGQKRFCSIDLKSLREAQIWISSIGGVDLLDLEVLENILHQQDLV